MSKTCMNGAPRFLWIGPYTSPRTFEMLVSKGYRDAAAHHCQWNFLSGFRDSGLSIDTISTLLSVMDTRSNDRSTCESFLRNGVDIRADLSTLPIGRRYLDQVALKNVLFEWVESSGREQKSVVFVYSLQSKLLHVVKALKVKYPHVKVVVLVPDLPAFMDPRRNYLKKMLKKFDALLIRHYLQFVDHFVLFTRKMADALKLGGKSWSVIEGCAPSVSIVDVKTQIKNDEIFRLAYCGGIFKRYGVCRFLRAIEEIKINNIEFVFSGHGDAVDELKQAAIRDRRIVYRGFLESNADVLDLQRSSSALINLRQPDEVSSDYCFPSKLFEYLLVGIPVLSWRMGGIPEEYFDFLIEINGTDPKDIASSIEYVYGLSKESRSEIGEKGRTFVATHRSPTAQVQRLLSCLQL